MSVTPSPEEEQEPGYVVATFQATDDDEPNTNNSLITFSIASIVPTTDVSLDPVRLVHLSQRACFYFYF